MQGRYERRLRSAGTDRYPEIVSAYLPRTRAACEISGASGGGGNSAGACSSEKKFGRSWKTKDRRMDGWKSWKRAENSFLTAWYQRVTESYVATWFFGVFQTSRMSTSTATGGGGGGGGGGGSGGGGGGVGGALTLMGCVREASPPPQNHQNQHHRTHGLGEYSAQNSVDPLPKGSFTLLILFI